MKTKMSLFLVLALFVAFTYGCGRGGKEDANDQSATEPTAETDDMSEDDDLRGAFSQMQNALKEIENNIQDAKNGKPVEVADFRALKELLPETMLGMDRTDFNGERSAIGNFKVSKANAEYKRGDKRMEVGILDGGGMGLAALGAAAWTLAEFDRENQDGFERTTTVDGFKAFEKFDNKTKNGELTVLYKDRFLVSISGRGIGGDDLRDAYKKLDLKKLNDL